MITIDVDAVGLKMARRMVMVLAARTCIEQGWTRPCMLSGSIQPIITTWDAPGRHIVLCTLVDRRRRAPFERDIEQVDYAIRRIVKRWQHYLRVERDGAFVQQLQQGE